MAKAGWYDYLTSPKVVANLPHEDLDQVALHEGMHESLAERTIVGYFARLLRSMLETCEAERQSIEDSLRLLIESMTVIQEGLACYSQYIVEVHGHSPRTVDAFANSLARRGHIYQECFRKAFLIEGIVTPEFVTDELTSTQLSMVRSFLLIDISRFSLNLPVDADLKKVPTTDELPSRIKNWLANNPPYDCWIGILQTLSSDHEKRLRLSENIEPLVRRWMTLALHRHEDGVYTGIQYGDSAEPILARIFPDRPHQDFLAGIRALVGDLADPPAREKPEIFSEYLKRECSAQFVLNCSIPVAVQSATQNDLAQKWLTHYRIEGESGAYVRICPNGSDSLMFPIHSHSLNQSIAVPSGLALLLCHHAEFQIQEDGRRLWNYINPASATYVEMQHLSQLLHAIATDDCVVCMDIDLSIARPFEQALHVAPRNLPVYLYPEPNGTFDCFLKVVRDHNLSKYGMDILISHPCQAFASASNPDIWIIWMIPRVPGRNLTIMLFGGTALLASVVEYFHSGSAPPTASLLQGGDMQMSLRSFPNSSVCADNSRDFWQFETHNNRILAPMNADVVTAHLLEYGC